MRQLIFPKDSTVTGDIINASANSHQTYFSSLPRDKLPAHVLSAAHKNTQTMLRTEQTNYETVQDTLYFARGKQLIA